VAGFWNGRDRSLPQKLSTGQVATVDGNYMLLAPPVFAVTVTNNTGHVVRMKGAVIKLIDSANNLYDPLPKDMALAKLDEADAVSARKGIALTQESANLVRAGVRQRNLSTRMRPVIEKITVAPPDTEIASRRRWLRWAAAD
jgi:hypothetical protein